MAHQYQPPPLVDGLAAKVRYCRDQLNRAQSELYAEQERIATEEKDDGKA